MSVVVTLHVYSGRENPSWELNDSQVDELKLRLRSAPQTTLMKPPGVLGPLGYRGFTINAVQEQNLEAQTYISDGVIDIGRFDLSHLTDTPELEEWLLGTGGNLVEDEVKRHVQDAISPQNFQRALSTAPGITLVPPYNPGKWNNNQNIMRNNNCYNYANDKITNTFAQPGRGSGTVWNSLDCSNVGSAAQRDGQISVSSASSTPSQGHYIALVMWPRNDYHWYRLDSNAMWSHKPGQTPARNTDNSNRLISDPKNCNRGPYTVFCGYYHCVPNNTRIR